MPRIDSIWAFIAEDTGPDDEGVTGFLQGDTMLPLIAADAARLDSLRAMAQHIATKTGQTLHLVKFTNREAVETVTPIPPTPTGGNEWPRTGSTTLTGKR